MWKCPEVSIIQYFFWGTGGSATIKHRCVTHLYGSNAIEQPHPRPFSQGEGSPAHKPDIRGHNNSFQLSSIIAFSGKCN